jgi:hypothetical protein
MTMFPLRQVSIAAAVCALFLASSPAAWAADGKVSGTVTFAGKPLPSGRVIFHLDNGQFVGSRIKDGKYAIDSVPVGDFKVTVEAEGIQRQYTQPETTPLKVQVQAGKSEINLELK